MKKNYKGDASLSNQTIERKYANRTADLGADVVVPLAQAGICAAIIAALVFLVGRRVDATLYFGLGALLAVWLILLLDHRRALWIVERVAGVDLNQDGWTGEPETVRVEVVQRRGDNKGVSYIDLPVSASELRAIAQLILVRGVSFSRNSFAGILSQPRYNELAQVMEEKNLIVQLPGNRRVLTENGAAMLEQILYPDGVPSADD